MMEVIVLLSLLGLPVLLMGYAYWGYPQLLRFMARGRADEAPVWTRDELPQITVTLPAYNEEARIAGALDAVLACGYPEDRLHVVVISDASTDRTDEIVRTYADRGVVLHRMPSRMGKTAAENASRALVRGDIIVNTDASVRLAPQALERLIAVFADPTVGVASGEDVSVGSLDAKPNAGEGTYVAYEMQVRAMETRVWGIVGASGCCFAIRRALHAEALPEELSRDFASALVAREHGLRAVSVSGAQCYVPRAASLAVEYRRKIRTMARGLRTLWYKRVLLSPARYGFFAFALWSHKAARWFVYPAVVVTGLGVGALALVHTPARVVFAGMVVGVAIGEWAVRLVAVRPRSSGIRLIAFGYAANKAGIMAWWEFLRGSQLAIWEPTRRPA